MSTSSKKTALVTGGSRGIGLGVARALAWEGFDLAINGMRPVEDILPVIEELKLAGNDVIYCRGDVGLNDSRQSIINTIRNHFGRLDVLVNNAGMAPRERRDILESSEESFEEVIRTNLQGAYFLTQSVANWMIEQKNESPAFKGSIINISSVSATVASVNRGEYCIAKAGLSMVTQLFAVRLGEFDIPVYELRPGIVLTDMTSGVKEKYDKMISDGLLIQNRWGNPDDIGKAVASLVRGDFPYSTGQVIMIDGGMTLGRL
jgi:3-oxoacyl-[acyl-carrier protein] reductase